MLRLKTLWGLEIIKKQNIEAEIDFFNEIIDKHGHFDTMSEEGYADLMKKISPYIGKSVLDAGCGTGAFGVRIKRSHPNIRLYGVDLNSRYLELANSASVYDGLSCANLEDQNIFGPLQFDTILCPYLLHHFPDMQLVVDNFYKWLRPEGYLIIIDPNGSNAILRITCKFRFILSRFLDMSEYGSINESHKSVTAFIDCLHGYKFSLVESFKHKSRSASGRRSFHLISLYVIIQKFLLNMYEHVPFIRYSGSDILIICSKKVDIDDCKKV